MKKIIGFLLSFQLIFFPQTFAQTPSEEELENLGNAAATATTTYDPLAQSKPTTGETSFFDMDCSNCGGIDFYTQQVFVLALSTIGSTIITQCPVAFSSPSMWAFIAASLAHTSSEILVGNAQSDRNKARLDDLKIDVNELNKYSKGDSKQRDALKAAKDEEEDLRDILNTKKWITMGVIAAFILASTLAAFENVKFLTPGAVLATNDIGCNPIKIEDWKILTTILNAAISAAFSMIVGYNTQGNISTYGGALFLILNLFTVPIQKGVMVTFATPLARTITFGSLALLEAPLLIGFFSREKIANDNIKKLGDVIKSFNLVSSTEEEGLDESVGDEADGIAGGGGRNSIKGFGTGQIKIKGICEGATFKECETIFRPLNNPNFNLGEFASLNDGLQTAVNFSNAMSRGNLTDAKVHATKLHNMAGNFRKIGDALRKKINEKLKAQNKPQIDFDKEMKNRVANFQKDFNQALVANKQVPMKDLTTFSGAPASLIKPEERAQNFPKQILSSHAKHAGVSEKNHLFSDDEENAEDSPLKEELKKSGDNLDKFDVQEADISKKSDVSIFVQLSNRYILNYNKIFKTLPPPPSNAKK